MRNARVYGARPSVKRYAVAEMEQLIRLARIVDPEKPSITWSPIRRTTEFSRRLLKAVAMRSSRVTSIVSRSPRGARS